MANELTPRNAFETTIINGGGYITDTAADGRSYHIEGDDADDIEWAAELAQRAEDRAAELAESARIAAERGPSFDGHCRDNGYTLANC